MMIDDYGLDLEVFQRYAGLALPRHVAYPMPTWWDDLDADAAQALLSAAGQRDHQPDLSLYLHVPFCERACLYCACNRVALPRTSPSAASRVDEYVSALGAEIKQYQAALGTNRTVKQIHWGGGTPTYLSCTRLTEIHAMLQDAFNIAPDAEIAIELDPRAIDNDHIQTLRKLGFNRLSFGIQDFDPRVQEHVQRIQPFDEVRKVVEQCRAAGFVSINFDLIYGLPLQTPQSIHDTLLRTIELSPDRIAYYQFAQIPDKIAVQRGLDYSRLPDSTTKLEMFLVGLKTLTDAGYEFIGLDHFAKPEEALAVALRRGTLQRNFQGMTTGGGLDLIGLGASSISQLAGIGYLQNVRQFAEYVAWLDEHKSPLFRGKRFTDDDVIRQKVLQELYCTGTVCLADIGRHFDIDAAQYFARELEVMDELANDGLVEIGPNQTITATLPLGRVLMRTTAAVFDAYLGEEAYRTGDRQYFSANA
jgi:oxygen-independent coproporphyrinogen-3 oxidase